MKIIGTGLSGLVGSRVVEVLRHTFQFENLSLETGVDITNKANVQDRIGAGDGEWVFHFAAMTDVDSAEQQRNLGKESLAWRVNVEGTRNVVEAARASEKRVLYLSTDFVFDGENGPYTEEDKPNPKSWYAITKYEGEKLVAHLGERGLILRIAFPYVAKSQGRLDFVHRMMERLRRQERIEAPYDQRITPTYLDDVARVIEALVARRASGIYHAVGSEALSPYEVALSLAKTHHLDERKIAPTTWAVYYKNRAPRPRNAVLKNEKIGRIALSMIPFSRGVSFIL